MPADRTQDAHNPISFEFHVSESSADYAAWTDCADHTHRTAAVATSSAKLSVTAPRSRIILP
jgi:hypothetical protein